MKVLSAKEKSRSARISVRLAVQSRILGVFVLGFVGAWPVPIVHSETPTAEIPSVTDMCAQTFQRDDRVQTASSISVFDVEFDYVNKRMVFEVNGNKLVVVDLDSQTGDYLSHEILDDGLTGNFPGMPAGIANGPEWGYSMERGYEIYYTKIDQDGNRYLASVHQRSPGEPWTRRNPPEGARRGLALSTFNLADPFPLIAYVGLDTQPFASWREDSAEFVEIELPFVDMGSVAGSSPGRFVPGKREMVGIENSLPQAQLARFDLDSGAVDFISEYSSGESINGAGVISLGGERYLFYALINFHHIDVFETTVWGQNRLVSTLRPPIGVFHRNKFLMDEENFLSGEGEPFITMIMDSDRSHMNGPSEVWVASAFATRPCHYRRISAISTLATVGDPEPLTVGSGTYIYYQQVINGKRRIRKAATGL